MRASRQGRQYWASDPAPRPRRRTQAEMLAEQRAEIEALDMDEAWMRRCIAELESLPQLDADNRRYLVLLKELVTGFLDPCNSEPVAPITQAGVHPMTPTIIPFPARVAPVNVRSTSNV